MHNLALNWSIDWVAEKHINYLSNLKGRFAKFPTYFEEPL